MSSSDKCNSCDRRFHTSDRIPRALPCDHLLCSDCVEDLLAPEGETALRCPECHHDITPDCLTIRDFPVSATVARWLNAIPNKQRLRDEQELTASSVLAGSGSEELPALLRLKSQDVSSLIEDAAELLTTLTGAGGHLRDKIKEHKKQQRLLRKGLSTLRSMEQELRSPTSAALLCAAVQEVSDSAAQHEATLRRTQAHRLRDKGAMDAEEVRRVMAGTRGCYAVFRYPRPSDTNSDSEDECHYAKLSIDGKYLLMAALMKQDDRPQDLVEEFVHSDLMRTVSPAGCVVYLDITQGGRREGRVFIRLEGDTVWSRHFLAMCAGQCRVSYRGTTFTAFNLGEEGERIDSVLPRSMQGETASLVDKSPPHATTMDIEAALVVGKAGPSPSLVSPSSPFSVYLRGWTDYEDVNTIGRVVGGLALLKGGCRAKEPLKVHDTGVLLNIVA